MENVRSCTQKMFAVRLLGSSVSAALLVLTGVGALVPSAVRAAQTETEPIRESRDFADDTVVDVSSAHVTLSTPRLGRLHDDSRCRRAYARPAQHKA